LGNTGKTHRNLIVSFKPYLFAHFKSTYIVSFNYDQLQGSEYDAVEAGNLNGWIQILTKNFGSSSDLFVEAFLLFPIFADGGFVIQFRRQGYFGPLPLYYGNRTNWQGTAPAHPSHFIPDL
jgi:hypothetical protein